MTKTAHHKLNNKKYSLLLLIVLILIAIPVSVETYTRKVITRRINERTATFFNTKTNTQLGNGLFTLQVLGKKIKNIKVSTNNPGEADVRFDAHIAQINMRNFNEPENITHLEATVAWPTKAIMDILNNSVKTGAGEQSNKFISAVTIDQPNQVIKIEMIGGFSTLTIKPVAADTKINFTVVSASAFGFELPQATVQNLVSALTKEIGVLPTNMHVEKIFLADNLVQAEVYGDNIPLN